MRNFSKMFFMFSLVLILSACSSGEFKPKFKVDIEPFEFTNHHEEEVSLEDLKGEVWLAQFVFTNCTSVCGPMMFNMADLQDSLKEEKVEDYKIVSFTVDPANDDPAALDYYLNEFAPADESKWEMLTGYKQQEIIDLGKKSFATIILPALEGSDQVTHATNFILVNQEGKAVKTYDGVGSSELPFAETKEEIIKDMKALIKQGA